MCEALGLVSSTEEEEEEEEGRRRKGNHHVIHCPSSWTLEMHRK